MNATAIIGDMRIPCQYQSKEKYGDNSVCIGVDMPITEIEEIFVDDIGLKVEWHDGTVKDCSEFKILAEIMYRPGQLTSIMYRGLTDIEKLIELHYGGVN